jgi:two-component system sensor histidine kinase QseC
MIISIRKFLLVNLLISIIITTSVTAIGNYILDQKDIQYHLDSLLSQSGLAFQVLLGNKTDTSSLLELQKALNSVPAVGKKYYDRIYNPFKYQYEDKFQFQVWNAQRQLIVHSANAPLEPLSNGKEGFSNKKIKNEEWRVFTTINPETHVTFDIAERYDIRAELGNRMARDDLYIMLLVYPLLGLNIWLIIGKGLDSLRRVADEVSHREPHYLEPVDVSSVPIEIKPLVEELNKLFLRLRLALEREKRFAADAAHELRTPLAALKAQAQLALKVSQDVQLQEIIHKIIASVDRSAHIVQQLLTLSRIVPEEANTLQDIAPVNMHKLAVDEISLLVSAALEKNIELELICEDETATIEGNMTALSIMLRNLVDNAIRYSPANSFVQVKIENLANEVVLSVKDNGPGIPAELRSRVFERFFRILGTKQSGSGLGLAIVQQIAMLHHAKVKLSSPDHGTGLIVTVSFPKVYTNLS